MDFNPLRREGGDISSSSRCAVTFMISIHSAARAETRDKAREMGAETFQSTPPRGRRRQPWQGAWTS